MHERAATPTRLRALTSATGAVSGTVQGTVLAANSKEPVAFVDVVFRAAREETSATSDASGHYEVELVATDTAGNDSAPYAFPFIVQTLI